MYYNININQKAIVEFNLDNEIKLDLADAFIIEYLQKQSTSQFAKRNFKIINNEVYYLLNYENIIKQLPLLNIDTKDAIGRRIKKLKNLKIIKHFIDRQHYNKIYFTTTELFEIFFSYQTVQEPKPNGSRTESQTVQEPNQYIDNNIKDNNIKDKINPISFFESLFNYYNNQSKIKDDIKSCKSKYQYLCQIGRITKEESYYNEKIDEYFKYIKYMNQDNNFMSSIGFKKYFDEKYYEEDYKKMLEDYKKMLEDEKEKQVKQKKERENTNKQTLNEFYCEEKEKATQTSLEKIINKLKHLKDEKQNMSQESIIEYVKNVYNDFIKYQNNFIFNNRYYEMTKEEKDTIENIINDYIKTECKSIRNTELDFLYEFSNKEHLKIYSIGTLLTMLKEFFKIKYKNEFKDCVFWKSTFENFIISKKDCLLNTYDLKFVDLIVYNKNKIKEAKEANGELLKKFRIACSKLNIELC